MEPHTATIGPNGHLPNALVLGLTSLLADRFTLNRAIREQHGSDESSYPSMPPDAVVWPESTDEVQAIVRLCAEHTVPIIPFGAGSSVEGHVLALQGGVCVDMSRMDKVLSIDTQDLSCRVQAGVTREALNTALAGTGYFFSVDPGADASLGGMVATGASGTNTVRYGTMRENLLSLTVVLANGEVVRTAQRARKSSAGYNLTQLFAGSEGTLGLITEVVVKVHPHPEAVAAAVVNFPDVRSAVDAIIDSLQMGVPLARAELLDALSIRAINAYSHTELVEQPTLFLEFCGSQAQVAEQAATVKDIMMERGGHGFQWADRPEDRRRLWTPRHHAYFACLQLRPGSRAVSTDACVPLSRLADCVAQTAEDIQASGLIAPLFGHVGDGNFHCVLLVDTSNPVEVSAAEALAHRVVQRAIAMEGTCTGEHGVGIHKIPYLQEEHGAAGVELMRRIKQALDPLNLLNPGKVVAVPGTPASCTPSATTAGFKRRCSPPAGHSFQ
jgi:D-lactate dehydrogenase (cytochrome)